ncbi:osteopontin [Brachyhypopomus gauderio]|uniref:osteopontin n=1 Tax=Brachyhypopomus gauderio TaxID=698409 RepID=UPI004041B1C1
MKAVIVFMLLFTIVYCHPVKRSASSSESSEEQTVVKRPPLLLQKAPAKPAQAAPVQAMKATGLDENTDDSDEDEEADTDSDTEGTDTEDADTDSSESEETAVTETTSAPPATVDPTQAPVVDNGRGDSMGYPVDYKKTIIYVDDTGKEPSYYKTYGSDPMEGKNSFSKKTPVHDGQYANDVEKHLKVHKALQVHNEVLEGDTSTPEESQGLEATSGLEYEDPSNRQGASPGEPLENDGASAGEGASASASESASASASQEETEESDRSSEEVTATPGAVDDSESLESQESDSDERTAEVTSESPDVVIAK